jgi:hypothetical protein
MRWIFLVIAFLATSAIAFDKKIVEDGTVLGATPCGGNICAAIEYEGNKYLVVGVIVDGTYLVQRVYEFNCKVIKIWDSTWKEA